jgi:hypothetical protein
MRYQVICWNTRGHKEVRLTRQRVKRNNFIFAGLLEGNIAGSV